MVLLIVGEKGQGKTKKLIEMANKEIKISNGNIVFINNDNRHIYDLHYNIRFVETSNFDIENYKIFYGFICGIQSQDSDIQKIFIDGLTKIIKNIDFEQISKLLELFEKFSSDNDVDFIITLNAKAEELPDSISKFLM